VERLRLEAARRALELTSQSVKQIAASTGFGTVETLHRAFQRCLSVTPLQYRARFSTPVSKSSPPGGSTKRSPGSGSRRLGVVRSAS
jgi:AraC-like DNA-binding protein